MPELRKDPVSQRWVIIASERAKRPSDFLPEEWLSAPSFDPLAEGNEDKTPHEIASYRTPGTEPNTPGWRVRVVPNKYPALKVEGVLHKKGDGIYDHMEGIGAHEIIVETPKTLPSFTSLPDTHVMEILWMYRERLLDLQKDGRLKYGMVFKNVGRAAGATLYHTHSQLIATPIVPRNVSLKLDSCKEHWDYKERCLFCDMLAQELEQQTRVVMDSGKFLAFAPYAPRSPFEIWIAPKHHQTRYEHFSPEEAEELGSLLKRILQKIEQGLGHPPYNYMLFTAPFRMDHCDYFHWHLEIAPRLTRVAGFEWSTGFYINPVPPEDAAHFLRNVII